MRAAVVWSAAVAATAFGTCAAGDRAKAEPAPIVCVATAGELPRQDLLWLVAHKKGKVPLNRAAGCLGHTQGITVPAVLLTLPEFTGPYSIKVAAPVGKTYFIPALQLLDEALQVRRSIPPQELRRRGMELSTEVFVGAPNVEERYLLVFIDPDNLGKMDTRTSMSTQTAFVGTGY